MSIFPPKDRTIFERFFAKLLSDWTPLRQGSLASPAVSSAPIHIFNPRLTLARPERGLIFSAHFSDGTIHRTASMALISDIDLCCDNALSISEYIDHVSDVFENIESEYRENYYSFVLRSDYFFPNPETMVYGVIPHQDYSFLRGSSAHASLLQQLEHFIASQLERRCAQHAQGHEDDQPSYEEVLKRSMELLRKHLSPRQLDQFEKYECFEVMGNVSKRPYVISGETYGNVIDVTEHARRGRKGWIWLCAVPERISVEENYALGDVLLAQKVFIENDEIAFRKKAKIYHSYGSRSIMKKGKLPTTSFLMRCREARQEAKVSEGDFYLGKDPSDFECEIWRSNEGGIISQYNLVSSSI